MSTPEREPLSHCIVRDATGRIDRRETFIALVERAGFNWLAAGQLTDTLIAGEDEQRPRDDVNG